MHGISSSSLELLKIDSSYIQQSLARYFRIFILFQTSYIAFSVISILFYIALIWSLEHQETLSSELFAFFTADHLQTVTEYQILRKTTFHLGKVRRHLQT
jgi:hypothetical protein